MNIIYRISDDEQIKNIGLSIRTLRRHFDFTMGKVSREMGLSKVTEYSRLERGKYTLCEIELLFRRAVFAIIRLYFKRINRE